MEINQMSQQEIIDILNDMKNSYQLPVTNLSKSDNKIFIIDDKMLISGDMWSNSVSDENYASVDAIHYFINSENKLVINFFEFKNMNLKKEDNSKITYVKKYLENLNNCEHNCNYYPELKRLCADVPNDKLIQLKIKATEMLFLLNSVYPENQDDWLKIEKNYYVVSKIIQDYPFESQNISNTKRRSPSRMRFDFLFKLQPYPFKTAYCITEKTFKKIIHNN